MLERAGEAVDLSHPRFGTHLVEHGDRGIVGQRLLRMLGRPDHRHQADALGKVQRERATELRVMDGGTV